ncbi:MAG: deoxyribodipyrimidine photo-lyase [Actinobacteria bacterium]|nr:deoxyribodipyrimidine photo-lyase [Actinomycetota bacterium]
MQKRPEPGIGSCQLPTRPTRGRGQAAGSRVRAYSLAVPSVLWFRRDLRLVDNPALLAARDAAGDDEVVALFVLDPRLWTPAGDVRRAWLSRSLHRLDAALEGRLVVRHGDPVAVVPAVAAAARASTVHIAADYGPYGAQRDHDVETALLGAGRELVRTGSPYAVAPGRVRKADGTPYRVYTPFYRAWCEHGWRAPAADPERWPDWRIDDAGPLACEGIPDAPELGNIVLVDRDAGAVRRHWDAFRSNDLASYDEQRDRADLAGTSDLSAHLRWGEIHPRTILADLDDSPAHTVFRKEIAWREFYADVLHHTPSSARTWLAPRFAEMEYDNGPEADRRFEAWCQGRTGFPFVDAGMRQLLAEGWMHNRVRMVTASFLVKDLHLPWQRGARWFMRNLRDGDIASNQHGWQWVAGSGTDASPYFRIFNPITQGLRFDPEGDYVRRYVPELRSLPGKSAHEPWKNSLLLAGDYPEPVVDHAEERVESLRRYSALPPR